MAVKEVKHDNFSKETTKAQVAKFKGRIFSVGNWRRHFRRLLKTAPFCFASSLRFWTDLDIRKTMIRILAQ